MAARRTRSAALAMALVASSPVLAQSIANWPEQPAFDGWAAKVVRMYDDPTIKCNKITGVDTTAVGAIRVKGIWCAQADGLGSAGMIAAVRMIGGAVYSSFRREFPKCKGPVAISLWDKRGNQQFGSRDWQ